MAMVPIWTCTKMYAKIKTLTGHSDLADADLLPMINHFYQNVMPLEFRLAILQHTYVQVLADDVSGYDLEPNDFLEITGPSFIDNLIDGAAPYVKTRFDWPQFALDWPEPTALGSHSKGLPYEVCVARGGEKITLFPRPVPDDNYILYVRVYVKPNALEVGGDSPIEDIWGPVICYDVAMDVLLDAQDIEPIEALVGARKFYADKITTREIMRFSNVRARGSF